MEMEKAENKPPSSQNPAAKRKREERARRGRGAASKHYVVVHRTGKEGDGKISARGESSWAKGCRTNEPATAEERARHVAEGDDARRGRT